MDPFPSPVLKYLIKRTLKESSVGFLQFDDQGMIRDFGGWLDVFGIESVDTTAVIQQQFPFLEGLVPMPQTQMILPSIEILPERHADIHLFNQSENENWLVFLDTTAQLSIHSKMQQKSNHLSLLQDRQVRIIDQYLGKLVANSLEQGSLNIQSGGERREVTILFADIRDFTAYSEQNPPGKVFDVLNRYLDAMIRPVLDQSGFVDNIIGDSIMAIFGMYPTILSPQSNAIIAAREMIESLRRLNRSSKFAARAEMQISVGIATGEVALGILGSKERKTFSAIGHHVNLASRLESLARPSEIVIDKSTYSRIGDYRSYFRGGTYTFKGINAPVPIFSWALR